VNINAHYIGTVPLAPWVFSKVVQGFPGMGVQRAELGVTGTPGVGGGGGEAHTLDAVPPPHRKRAGLLLLRILQGSFLPRKQDGAWGQKCDWQDRQPQDNFGAVSGVPPDIQ
jgi:hypothetical protein